MSSRTVYAGASGKCQEAEYRQHHEDFPVSLGRRRLLKSDRPRITPRIAESVVLTLRICFLLYAGCPSDDFATYSKTVTKAGAGAVAANGTAEDPYEYAAVC
jgi:hypothetical protein